MALCCIFTAACTSDEAAGTTLSQSSRPSGPPPIISVPVSPYRPSPIAYAAAVTGTVLVVGDAPAEVVVRPTMDQPTCGTEFTDPSVVLSDGRLANVVVWLTDIRTGRQLPTARRFTVTTVACQLEPRVQAVIAGGTLNVRSRDPIPQSTRITRQENEAMLAIVNHTGSGQVVPDDRVLSQPGLLQLTSDLHPWTRGWIAVFDHPYFDVTTADGAFSLEGVPPGNYTLAAWHERLGRIEQPVTVGPAERVAVTLRFMAPEQQATQTP